MLTAQPLVGYSLRWSPQRELGFWRTASAGTSEQPGFVTLAGTQDRLLHASPKASVSTGGQVSDSKSTKRIFSSINSAFSRPVTKS